MFILFGYISIALVQLYQQYRRRSHYSQTMLRALRTGSVLVQRGKCVKHGSVGALLNSPLLTCSRSYKETQLLVDDHLAVSVVNPRQRVDLGEWTSYLDVHPGQDGSDSVIVLLEAGRPDNLDTFVQEAVQVPMAQQVHVLQHGCPIAWKSGSPFGIILHCNYRSFVLLCDAFGQGRLTLDEDLELYRLLTVSAVGRPQSLKRRSQHVGQEKRAGQSEQVPLSGEENHTVKDLVKHGHQKAPASEKQHLHATYSGAKPRWTDEQGKVMSPLTIDCSEDAGMVNDYDGNSSSEIKRGKSSEREAYNSVSSGKVGISAGDSSDFDTDLPTESEMQMLSKRGEAAQRSRLQRDAAHKNGSVPVQNGHSSKSDQNHDSPKTESAKEHKEAPAIEAVPSARSIGGKSPVGGTDKSAQLKKERPRLSKPPNVLVYCGIKDSARKFGNIKSCLEQCLNIDTYTLYHLAHEQVTTTPWADNSAALVIACEKLYDNIERRFSDYLMAGGKVISFGSSMESVFLDRKEVQKQQVITKFGFEKWKDVSSVQGCHQYVQGSLKKGDSVVETVVVDPNSGEPLVVLLTLSGREHQGRAVFSQLLLERDPAELAVDSQTFSRLKQSNSDRLDVMRHLFTLLDLDTSATPAHCLTPCYLLAHNQDLKRTLLDSLAGRMKQGVIKSRSLSLHFVQEAAPVPAASSEVLPVLTSPSVSSSQSPADPEPPQFFQPEVYWKHLSTSVLGQVVFYTDVIPTTMTVFEGLQFSVPEHVGVIAIAGRQTSGKGRGGNAWLSPVGCAMFTLPVSVPVDSSLGQRVTFLQHIVGLAVVHSIRSMPGYQDVELRLKWPNDIYYRDQMKLGGVLVTSTIMGGNVHATIGCGVNVANSHPTICINDIIQHHNTETGSSLSLLSPSQVVAMTVSAIERLMSQFKAEGPQTFCELYYKYWLHSGVSVQLESEGEEVEICGLDNYGFLQVTNKHGKLLSVQPDGNTFDMMRNLIALKKQ